MNAKRPIELLKKKVTPDAIMYKFKWNNNSVSIEPMTQLTSEMLVLVHEYELKQMAHDPHEPKVQKHVKHDVPPPPAPVIANNGKKNEEQKSGRKQAEKPQPEKQTEKPQEKQQEKVVEKPQIQQQQQVVQDKSDKSHSTVTAGPHKPRKSRVCQVKQVRQDNGRVDFLVCFEDLSEQQWISLEEIKLQAPVAVCDFLLGKVKYGGGQQRK